MMKVATMVAGEQEALPSVTSVCRLAAPRPRQANNSQDQRETGYSHGARRRICTWVPGVSIGSAGGKIYTNAAVDSIMLKHGIAVGVRPPDFFFSDLFLDGR